MSTMTNGAPTPTDASAWNGQHTQTVTLPSGNVAEIREKFPVYMMLRTGQFTPEMFEAFTAWQEGRLSDPALAGELVDLLVCAMFIKPRVTRTGVEGTVAIDQVDDADIDMVLELAGGGRSAVSFRDDDDDGADPGVDSAGVERDSVEPARPPAGKPGGTQRRRKPRGKAA